MKQDNILLPEYKLELINIENKMLEAQLFAQRFPAFSEKIIRNKFTNDFTGEIASSYKGMYFGWGIKRYFYTKKENIINYKGDFSPQYLWNLYINEYSLFHDERTDTGLRNVANTTEIFFFDQLNTTFYATDVQLMPLLDALSEWYEKAVVINNEFRKEKKKQNLMKQLEDLK